jgi:serine/threonine protein kinase/Rieske Fe-S protein
MYETQQHDLLVGQMVGGYRVEQLLSKGRISAVYLAREPVKNVPVAITAIVIPEDFSVRARNRFIRRFVQIATALLELDHPHILPIYDFGEQLGYPYLVTPYVSAGSLAHVLKREERCTPAYALEVLEQVAEGLDYAHARGVVHRALKPANVVLQEDEQRVSVAGFGLVEMLQLHGIRRVEHPYAHLLSLAGTFLGAPEYLAPEVVLGQQPVDARADIYALGIMLYELLSGKPPFTGTDSLEIALHHVKMPIPALRSRCPAAPPEIDAVLAQALARDPRQRFPSAGALVAAYARAIQRGRSRYALTGGAAPDQARPPQAEEEDSLSGRWQLRPPIVTGRLPSVRPDQQRPALPAGPARLSWQDRPLPVVPVAEGAAAEQPQIFADTTAPDRALSLPGTMPLVLPAMPAPPPMPVPDGRDSNLDTFAWWSGSPAEVARAYAASNTPAGGGQAGRIVLPAPDEQTAFPRRLPAPPTSFAALGERPLLPRRRTRKKRRQVVALLAGSGVVAAGLGLYLGVPGVRAMLGQLLHPQTGGVVQMPPQAKTVTATPKTSPRSSGGHQGQVIGTTALAVNSAQAFTNPANGGQALLIHLPDGQFTAYSRSCTHEGVAVNYDPDTHLLVCPAHGAIFDPANKGSVVQGPAVTPLPQIVIRVNADGTITTA